MEIRDGRRWISETVVNGGSVLRMMIINYRTEERHLAKLQDVLTSAARTGTAAAKLADATGSENHQRDSGGKGEGYFDLAFAVRWAT
jgi:hypothetical protein